MRIIAGTARGRRFDAPEGMDTRPTLDQVRESIFGMLQFDVPGARVLDLFSGSGALGLEAASRGATRVVCNDHARDCYLQIRRNVSLLGFDEVVEVMQRDYADCLAQLCAQGGAFDIVLLDAPYADGTAQKAAQIVLTSGLLTPNGRIVIEHAPDMPPQVDESLYDTATTRRYGKCAVTVMKGRTDV